MTSVGSPYVYESHKKCRSAFPIVPIVVRLMAYQVLSNQYHVLVKSVHSKEFISGSYLAQGPAW